MQKTVAIIGAGAAGLTAIKCCLDEGLEPVAFESDPWLGGAWKYTDLSEETERRGCVFYSTNTNTSKHVSCYSDFPIPKDWPNYLSQQKYLEYFQLYAKQFRLEEKIRYESKVTSVEPCTDFNQSGRWRVHYLDKKLGKGRTEEFDFVMVCTGINWDPRMPHIPGMDRFNGDVIHSKEYRTWKKFEGKRVVVVGFGNSAGDIACELSRHASQVYLSVRSGGWVVSRLADRGVPIDCTFLRRFVEVIPSSIRSQVLRRKLESKLEVNNFGLGGEQPPDKRFPIINDELPNHIMTGSIQVKAEIAKMQGSTIQLTDGSKLDCIDAIIFCTGYKFTYPILSDTLLHPKDTHIPLFKYVFPPMLNPGTLAIIGAVRVNGPVPPIVEIQSRWAVRVFTGKSRLPDCQTMMDDVELRQKTLEANTVRCCRAFHLVNVISYMDEIASLIGAKPNLWHLLTTDPQLAFRCFFGPCIPAQYRLLGPGTWLGARDIIMGVQDSTLFPLKTRKIGSQDRTNKIISRKGSGLSWMLGIFVALILFVLMRILL